MRKRIVLCGGMAAAMGGLAPVMALGASSDSAPMMSYLGLPQLIAQYGASLATGSNVNVSIAEANGYPSTSDGRFAGKTMTAASIYTATDGAHATTVGARFFGNTTGWSQRSIAPAIPNVWMYSATEFNGAYLKSPGSPEPYGSPNASRVASHAYAESNTTLDSITRLDYLVQRDDFLQVVDTRNYSTQGNSMNAIVITPDGGTSTLTSAVGSGTPYVAGRVSPVITGPVGGAGSDAIGQIAGVTALLVSRGKTTHSNVSYVTRGTIGVTQTYAGGAFTTSPISGYTVHSGDTSEVVKAALMAGALRSAPADNTLGISGISDYRAVASNQSSNGLDKRFGAGMVNALQSYRIIDAGETDSHEDGGNGGIGQYGFDYDAAFGGQSANAAATYGFTADASGKFMATLAWNLKIAGADTAGGNFSSAATLYNLSLTLTDVTAGNAIVQQSASLVDNTQTLWTDLIAGHTYHLGVAAVGAPFSWDYGLAWRSEVVLTPTSVPEPLTGAAGGVIGVGMLMVRRRRS